MQVTKAILISTQEEEHEKNEIKQFDWLQIMWENTALTSYKSIKNVLIAFN